MTASLLERVAERIGPAGLLEKTTPQLRAEAARYWPLWARPEQLPPPGDWRTWLVLAGRGFGKSRTGAEWVREMAMKHPGCHIALVAPTTADARDVMVHTLMTPWKGGVLPVVPLYEPSKRMLTWPNGSWATTYSADEPERLRGPEHHYGWCDEIAAWRYPEAWDQFQFGLRLGNHAQAVATTTPKPPTVAKVLGSIMAAPSTVITRGRTFDNALNLDATSLAELERRYANTRLGRQELEGQIVEGVEGALWTPEMIDRTRVSFNHAHQLVRTVVGVDPATTSGENSDMTGIVVCAKAHDGQGFVLADYSCKLSPDGWARRAVQAYHRFHADRIVCETNMGGDAWEVLLRNIDPHIAYKGKTARWGKTVRAEPIAALYEQGKISHQGMFAELEDQMCSYTPDGYTGSPDRVDALVWALTELMLGKYMPDDDAPLTGGNRRE